MQERNHEPTRLIKETKTTRRYHKIAQQTASQAVIGTMLSGIIIGNMGISTILIVIGMLPSIIFAVVGAKYAGKHGAKMCVTTANTSFMADIIDYELDRSGLYVPAVVTGTYSLIDKLISSFSAVIATGAVALIGYTTTMPQPGDEATPAIFWMTMAVYFGLPILGWICTIVAMKFCRLDREEMVEVQKRIEAKKNALKGE